eukprot:gnl/Chilomastix_cuspidata/5273.p1 GENE.gnl/Chilomastix_cuspidata/5273~~gnl/Chilomastix_cuspidata/5273.p1  ORF type:complete len:895 (+),score=97.03 gnl/Chilomastix_cuspidata/5273:123-2807(+)
MNQSPIEKRHKKVQNIYRSCQGKPPHCYFAKLCLEIINIPHATSKNGPLIKSCLEEITKLLLLNEHANPKIYDVFLELKFLDHITRLGATTEPSVVTSVFDSFHLLLSNIKDQAKIFYLLSSNHINQLVQYQCDHIDIHSYVVAHFISFLKSIALRFDISNIQFFFNTMTDSFPLLEFAVGALFTTDSLVNASAATIVLKCCAIPDVALRRFIYKRVIVPMASRLAWEIQLRAGQLTCHVMHTHRTRKRGVKRQKHRTPHPNPLPKIENAAESLIDVLILASDFSQKLPPILGDILQYRVIQLTLMPTFIGGLLAPIERSEETRFPEVQPPLSVRPPFPIKVDTSFAQKYYLSFVVRKTASQNGRPSSAGLLRFNSLPQLENSAQTPHAPVFPYIVTLYTLALFVAMNQTSHVVSRVLALTMHKRPGIARCPFEGDQTFPKLVPLYYLAALGPHPTIRPALSFYRQIISKHPEKTGDIVLMNRRRGSHISYTRAKERIRRARSEVIENEGNPSESDYFSFVEPKLRPAFYKHGLLKGYGIPFLLRVLSFTNQNPFRTQIFQHCEQCVADLKKTNDDRILLLFFLLLRSFQKVCHNQSMMIEVGLLPRTPMPRSPLDPSSLTSSLLFMPLSTLSFDKKYAFDDFHRPSSVPSSSVLLKGSSPTLLFHKVPRRSTLADSTESPDVSPTTEYVPSSSASHDELGAVRSQEHNVSLSIALQNLLSRSDRLRPLTLLVALDVIMCMFGAFNPASPTVRSHVSVPETLLVLLLSNFKSLAIPKYETFQYFRETDPESLRYLTRCFRHEFRDFRDPSLNSILSSPHILVKRTDAGAPPLYVTAGNRSHERQTILKILIMRRAIYWLRSELPNPLFDVLGTHMARSYKFRQSDMDAIFSPLT